MADGSGALDWLIEGEHMLEERDLPAALAAFECARLAGDPDFDRRAAGCWMAYMLAGEFEKAWLQSDEIRLRGRPNRDGLWQGERIAGKRVIVRCLRGLGDAVQMFRYIPLLRGQVSRLIVEVPPALLELAAYLKDYADVVTWGGSGASSEPEWDVQVEITELPYIFRTLPEELPITQRYVRIPKCNVPGEARQEGSLRVGIVWSCGEWNPTRSVPASLVRRILDVPGCEYWNLQGGQARHDPLINSSPLLHDAEECAESVGHLAALIARLDLVITPDTLAAHLAGAIGTPVWVMLQFAADWRWMIRREDSPWYPPMRLMRQPRQGNWEAVMENVGSQLHDLVQQRSMVRARR